MASSIRDIQNTAAELNAEQDPIKKLKLLEKSKEDGIISEEEYLSKKSKIEEDLKEFENKARQKEDSDNSKISQEPKKSDKSLIYGIAFILILFAAVFSYAVFFKQEPKTIEELHVLNLKGKLKPQQGYVYNNAYSFVKFENEWYTQLVSPKGTKNYNLAMRYTPRDLDNFSISGNLDNEFFNRNSEYYVTFNPTAQGLQYVVLGAADFNTHMTKIFEKMPIAACDRNETSPCLARPIVDCSKNDSIVIYFKDAKEFFVSYDKNCIVIAGEGFDLVRGTYKVLYNLYGIMEQ